MIIGITIGAAIVYILMKNNQNTLSTNLKQPNLSFEWKPLSDTSQEQQIIAPQTDINETAYKNSEKWKITRNDNGDIDQIEVIRDAKITK